MSEQTSQSLIESFFQALTLVRLEQCQTILTALEAQVKLEPEYQPWYTYLAGVLANEKERDFVKAERIFNALLEQALDRALQQRVLIALGRTYDYLGRWSETLTVYEKCLTLCREPQFYLERVKIWKNMAITLEKGFAQNEFDGDTLQQGVNYCRQALATLQEIKDPDEEEIWLASTTWNTLGLIYKNLGYWSQAEACYHQFATLSQQLADQHSIAVAKHNLGEIFQQYGPAKLEAAQQAYQEALEIFQKFADFYEQINVLINLGSLYRQLADPAQALHCYQQALDLAESIRARLTAPTGQADYRATIDKLYLAPLSIYLEQGEAAQAFSAAERARSRVLADLLAGQEAKPHADIPPHLLEQRADLRQLLDQAYADPARLEDATASARLAALEKALADLDRQIELLDPAYAALATVDPLTAEAVCGQLPADAVLLTYTADDQDRLWILTASPSGVRANRVENLSLTWLTDYLAHCLDGPRRGGLLPKLPGGYLGPPHLFPALYQALIAPVWDRLGKASTVYIVPFGPLHYLPLGALTPAVDQPAPLLAGGRRVVYAPSATILFSYCYPRPASSRASLLAVAPADESLRVTNGAAQAIARHPGGLAYTGASATRQLLLAEAGQHRLICFLGHALFDQQYPMSSRLKLVDGTLHASEILRELRLQADLVILSACETGRSRVLAGDEILGLSRALLYAGTPALLVTLWAVHEIPTRLLVEKLVADLLATPAQPFNPGQALARAQNWLRALSLAEARRLLRGWAVFSSTELQAQLAALWQMTHPAARPQAADRLFSHPFFWSPYILIGERGQVELNPSPVTLPSDSSG